MIGELFSYIVSVLAAIFLVWLYIKVAVWLRRRKHPEDNYMSTFTDDREALDAFANPHDPILNPRPSKSKK